MTDLEKIHKAGHTVFSIGRDKAARLLGVGPSKARRVLENLRKGDFERMKASTPAAIANASPRLTGEGLVKREDKQKDSIYDDAVRLVRSLGCASTSKIQSSLSIGYGRAARIMEKMYQEGVIGPPNGSKMRTVSGADMPLSLSPKFDSLESTLKDFLTKNKRKCTIGELSQIVDRSEISVRAALKALYDQGFNVELNGDNAAIPDQLRPGNAGDGPLVHDISAYTDRWFQFGALGDNHLGSKHERLDVLTAAYDLYQKEKVSIVFNTGNWIEGEMRLNFHDVKVHGLDAQIDYMLEHYPQRKGITTYFVAGDDHEGWYQRNLRLEVGRLVQLRAEEKGRKDLKYLGFVEADVILKTPNGHSILKVMHPGGGSSYAHSYAPQKIVESFQGGEKPQVLLIGHYHKFEYCFPREVHVVQTACTVDQSIFMRKQKIAAHVGFTLCRLNQAANGTINRFQVEYFPFYDRGYYGKGGERNFGLTQDPMPVLSVLNGKME